MSTSDAANAVRLPASFTISRLMSSPAPPISLLPKPGQQRAFWRAPASPSALAWAIARAADQHDGPLLVVARGNHVAHQLESDLRTLIGDDATLADGRLPIVPFPDWETLPYDQFSPHPDIVSQRLSALQRLPACSAASSWFRSRP